MKLSAELAGEHHQVSLLWSEGGVAEIDGRPYKIDLRELGEDEYLLTDGNRIYDCRVSASGKDFETAKVSIRGTSYAITISDPKRLRSTQQAGQHDKGSVQIVAAMPGKVVRVLLEVGAQVETGTGILVVEAMKMQNEMKSPKAGKLVSISAEAGATVNAGEILAVIE